MLVVGQDPYPTPGHPVGLSFSVAPDVRPLPKSLVNIYRELVDDVGCPPPTNGDLSPWFEQGVMLLNRALTVAPGAPASHRGKGWESVTEQAIDTLAQRGGPLVAVLWGRDAQGLKPMLGDVPWVDSVHPSPLSASRGFFGSRPFTPRQPDAREAGRHPGRLVAAVTLCQRLVEFFSSICRMTETLALPSFADATVVVPAPGHEPGNWAGAASAVLVDGVYWLTYRVRRPTREGRGVSVVVARSDDGEHFVTVAEVRRETFGAESFERPVIVPRPEGGWRLYLSCATPGLQALVDRGRRRR